MPKIRKQRTKYHYSKPQVQDSDSVDQALPLPSLKDDPRRSVDGEAPVGKPTATSKKARREIRRNEWLKKMGSLHGKQLELEKEQKRKQTVIVGDTMPLHEALAEVSQVIEKNSAMSEERLEKQRMGAVRVVSRNKRRMVLASESKRFQAVLSNKEFKSDPLKAVSDRLKACNAERT